MIRHSQNSNLTLHYEQTYQGYPVQTERGPLIRITLIVYGTLFRHPCTNTAGYSHS
ncbi:MAG: hypothetical protein RIR18_641 [Pseudomonadota bacterium]|jgi:hypothetical protein